MRSLEDIDLEIRDHKEKVRALRLERQHIESAGEPCAICGKVAPGLKPSHANGIIESERAYSLVFGLYGREDLAEDRAKVCFICCVAAFERQIDAWLLRKVGP